MDWMKKRHFILKGIITALVLIVLFYTGRWAFFNIFHRQDVVDGLVALRTNVMHSMEDGNDSDIFYVKNVKIKDISDINKYVDSAFGSVDTYRVLVSSGDYLAIQLSFDRSENYYVIRKVLFDEEIPSDKKKALAMYDSYIEFYKTCIKEPMSDFDKEKAAHDYLIKNCVYGFPEEQQDAYDAYGVLVSHKAVCDGYAEAFFMLMTCLDIPCDIVVGTADGDLHAWNQIELDGEWYNIDLTWDDAVPDMGEYVKHTYFNLTDDTLAENHTWEREFYRTCTDTNMNYYVKTFAVFDDFEAYKKGITKQIGRSDVLEAIVYYMDTDRPDLSFLYDSSAIKKLKYLVEDMGEYYVIIVYVNT
jgi:hypothetical protein